MDETLERYESGKEIVDYLLGKKERCDEIKESRKLFERMLYDQGLLGSFASDSLGTGTRGIVSNILIDDQPGTWVIKDYFDEANDNFKHCLRTKPKVYKSNITNKQKTIKPPYYKCPSTAYSEYVLSLFVSKLYEQGVCINFLRTLDFVTCEESMDECKHRTTLRNLPDSEPTMFTRYMIMEKASSPLSKVFDATQAEGAFIQTLVATAIFQDVYKISHNDLHIDNVMITPVEHTTWGGSSSSERSTGVAGADYFHYSLHGTDIYFPAISFIIKIIDWGLGTKWKPPVIAQFKYEDVIPNQYTPQFDSLSVLFMFALLQPPTGLVREMFEHIFGETADDKFESRIVNKLTSVLYGRPSLEVTRQHPEATAMKLLTNLQLMKRYMTKPEGGKIVTLGRI